MALMIEQFEYFIWTYLTIPTLIAVSVLMTLYYRGVQFRFISMFKALKPTRKKSDGISSFQSLTMSLAARVGVGSLAGVALAIYIGGPGSIFWMWICAFLTAAASFTESTLAQLYKRRDGKIFVGGPAYYIEEGIGRKGFGVLYAILIIITYTFGFTAIQANTIATSFSDMLQLPPLLTGVGLAALTGLIIFGGTQTIAHTTAKIVPFMSIFYVLVGVYVMILNVDYIPVFFKTIFEQAFGLNQISGATIGLIISTGFKRSIFCSEAGMGSGAHAAATTDSDHPTDQGFIQALGVYITMFLISTITAFLIMVTNAQAIGTPDSNGIEMTLYALTSLLGKAGGYFLSIAIFFFAFSTILTGYFYGESNIKYLFKNMKILHLIRIAVIILIVIAALGSPSLIWSLVDTLVGLTATLNVIAICYLAKQVKHQLDDLNHRRR